MIRAVAHFTTTYVFPWNSSCRLVGVLHHTPRGSGDLIRMEVNGKTVLINPYCSQFVGLEYQQEEETS